MTGPIFAVDSGQPLFNAPIRGEPQNSEPGNLVKETNTPPLYDVKHILIS